MQAGAPPTVSTHAEGAAPLLDLLRSTLEDGSVDPAFRAALSDGVALYRHMVTLRLVSARMIDLQRSGKVASHSSCLGEEAVIVAASLAARANDWVFPGVREWGAALVRGLPMADYMHHAFGSARDAAKGHSAPDHPPARNFRVGPASGIAGAHVPQAVGAAWAAKIRKDDVATIAIFGDAATSAGDIHNGLNFAGVFKAPVVFLCRNNGWAISCPTERQTGSATFAEKGVAYGIPSVRVDGNDLLAVIKVTQDAVARCARGEGPTLIEALTYRMSGHSTSDDPRAYRPEAGLEAWKELDPIARLRRHLERLQPWTEANEKALSAEIDVEIKAAVDVAEKTPEPSLDSMFDDVFATPPWHLVEQREALKKGPRPGGH